MKKKNKMGRNNKCTICGLRSVSEDSRISYIYGSSGYCEECRRFLTYDSSDFPKGQASKLIKIRNNIKKIWVQNRNGYMYGGVRVYEEVRKFLAKIYEDTKEQKRIAENKRRQTESKILMTEVDKLMKEMKG